MSKGIAINTILYLLLGVLVVGVVVYLVYTYAVGPGMDVQACTAVVQNWCSGCNIAGWSGTAGVKLPTSDVYTCINNYFKTGTLDTTNVDCSITYTTAGDTKTFCESFG